MVVGNLNLHTKDIPLTVYESKAGKPYMNLKGWAESKEPEDQEQDMNY